jgi:plasmid stability protein
MAISIRLDDNLATQLQVQADALNLSIEELARQILGDAVGTGHDSGVAWQACNQRRVALIRKQFAEGLCPEESGELQQLQEQADKHVEHRDAQRLEALKHLYSKTKRIIDTSAG